MIYCGIRVDSSLNLHNTTHAFSFRQLGELRSRSLGLKGLIDSFQLPSASLPEWKLVLELLTVL